MFNRFFHDENGQTTVEYLLIIAVIVVASFIRPWTKYKITWI